MVIGVRPCELKALAIHDQILSQSDRVDPHYTSLRQSSIIIALNCTRPGATCFCASMKTGPHATEGYDLLMTEVVEKKKHYFVIKSGSEMGDQLISKLPVEPSAPEQVAESKRLIDKASTDMGRELELDGDADISIYGAESGDTLGAGLALGEWKPHQNIFWESIYPGLIFGVIILSTQLKSKTFLIFGSLALGVYLTKITAEYFSDSLGWAFSLVVVGFLLMGVAYLAVRIKRQYITP